MADEKTGAAAVLTGSTDKPGQDSTVRGLITGVLIFGVGYAEARVDIFTDTELAAVVGLVGTGVLVAAGQWDKHAKRHLK